MVMRFRQVFVSVLASAAALWLPPASAGSFGISPLRLELAGQARTAVLTVRNDEDAPALIQVETLLWTQDDGQDRLDLDQGWRVLVVSHGEHGCPGLAGHFQSQRRDSKRAR